MATTLPTGAVAPSQSEQTGTKKAVSLIDSLLSTPTLATGTTITPQAQNIQSNELLSTPGVTGTLAAQAGTAVAPTVTAAAALHQLVLVELIYKLLDLTLEVRLVQLQV